MVCIYINRIKHTLVLLTVHVRHAVGGWVSIYI